MTKRLVFAVAAALLAVPAQAAALRLSVAPRDAQAGEPVTFQFRTVPRAKVVLAGHRVRADRRGRAAMRIALPREGTFAARARRGRRTGRAPVVAHARPAQSPRRAESFRGNCDFTGTIRFTPGMQNEPQPVEQHGLADGTCTGTFTDAAGHERQLDRAPVKYRADSAGDQVSCIAGTAEGEGAIAFPDGSIAIHFSETRAAAVPYLRLTGAHSGAMDGIAAPAASQDPVAALQACGGEGLETFDLQAHFETNPEISG